MRYRFISDENGWRVYLMKKTNKITFPGLSGFLLFAMLLIIVPLYGQDVENSKIFHKAVFLDSYSPEVASHKMAESGMQKIIKARFDTIFLQVRYMSEVFYNSAFEPRSIRVEQSYPDPLNDYILMAHHPGLEKPLKINAWFTVFPCYSGVISNVPPNGHIMQIHPEWVTVNYDGEKMDHNKLYHLDPGVPSVQKYIQVLVMEIVKNYDVDGILLDGFRYPDDGLNWGYNPEALSSYYRDTGLSEKPLPHDPRWCDWRRAQLTSLIEKIFQNIKRIKPQVQLYIGGVAWSSPEAWEMDFKRSPAYSLVFQDWIGWLDKGLADGAVVYNYKQFPQQKGEFNEWIDMISSRNDKEKFICGIGGFFNFSETIINQINTARRQDLGGVALYCFRLPSKDNKDLLFKTLPLTGFSPRILDFPRSGIRSEKTPKPVPEIETSPTLSLSDVSTETLLMQSRATPTPLPVIVPASPGLPSLPNLAELVTPTPVVTPVPPTPTPTPKITPSLLATEKTPSLLKKEIEAPAPTPRETAIIPYATTKWDNIYLKNGSSIKGKILEEVEGKATIETSKGFIMTLPVKDIEKVVKYR